MIGIECSLVLVVEQSFVSLCPNSRTCRTNCDVLSPSSGLLEQCHCTTNPDVRCDASNGRGSITQRRRSTVEAGGCRYDELNGVTRASELGRSSRERLDF